MPYSTIKTEDIISKYKEVYPEVEGLVSDGNALYKQGLADIERLYDEWDITGADRARYVAEYISNSTVALINGAMQVSLGLLDSAYTLPMQQQNMLKDIEYKQAQIELLDKEIEYKEAQIDVLKHSEILNALIKSFQSLSDMAGSMGSGGIVPPTAFLVANKASIISVFKELNKYAKYEVVPNSVISTIDTVTNGDEKQNVTMNRTNNIG